MVSVVELFRHLAHEARVAAVYAQQLDLVRGRVRVRLGVRVRSG